LLRTTAPHERPLYEPSKRRVTWPNGSWATIYSDDEPDQVRGFSGDTAWLDEFAKFKNAKTFWDNMQFGMREASRDRPRCLTPRPLAILKEIEALPSTITVTGTSHENRANLDPSWLADTIAPYEGTRLGRQEIGAEYIASRRVLSGSGPWFEIAGFPVSKCPHMRRVVVALDPPASSGGESALAGIERSRVRRPLVRDGGLLGRMSPGEWGARAFRAFDNWFADRIVAEGNQGGEMDTIQTVRKNALITIVQASRSKQARAERVAALYEQGKVSHIGTFPELEDQLCSWEPLSGMRSRVERVGAAAGREGPPGNSGTVGAVGPAGPAGPPGKDGNRRRCRADWSSRTGWPRWSFGKSRRSKRRRRWHRGRRPVCRHFAPHATAARSRDPR
jgi:phage terminase large subunit-like protein